MRLEYLVEKNTHLRRFEGTGGVLKYGADLRKRHARKPVHEVRDVGPIIEILEEGSHRNTGAAKHPRATDTLGVTLHSWTRRPVNHTIIVDRPWNRFNCADWNCGHIMMCALGLQPPTSGMHDARSDLPLELAQHTTALGQNESSASPYRTGFTL